MLAEKEIVRILLPAAWTTANLTLQLSEDGVTYADLYDSYGIEYTIIASASRDLVLPNGDLRSIRYFKLRSGSSAAPVNQASDRVMTVVWR